MTKRIGIAAAGIVLVAAAAAAEWQEGIPKAHPRIYLNTENTERLRRMLASGAPQAKRFGDMVDSVVDRGRNVYGFSAADAALMYRLTGRAKYAEKAVAMIDASVKKEQALIAAGKRARVSGDSYLHVGGLIGNLAKTYDWCHDKLTDEQKRSWTEYANQAVWNVWHHREAEWGGRKHPWSGWSVNNAGNNYYYSFLRATMTLGLATRGENPKADEWLRFFREEKVERQLMPYFKERLAGGGSREGTGYGTSHREVFHLLETWRASAGENLAERLDHPRESILYMIHSTVPGLDRIAPIGDHARDSSARLFDYHRDYVLSARALVKDAKVREAAQRWLRTCSVPRMRHGFMAARDFIGEDPSVKERPLEELSLDYYAPGTGHIFMRSSWERDAAWASFICGPFDESHAHEDQGSFVIDRGGWLATDENVYTHSGIHQGVPFHNLVYFWKDGKPVKQVRSREFRSKLRALESNGLFCYVAADLSDAHVPRRGPKKSPVSWTRQFLFIRPGVFVVFDRAGAGPESEATWTLNLPTEPKIEGNTVTVSNGKAKLTSVTLMPNRPKIAKLDWQSLNRDPKRKAYRGGWRVDVPAKEGAGGSHFLHVLYVDDAVKKVETSQKREELTAVYAHLTLADGTKVTASFDVGVAGAAGRLRIERAGKALHEGPLASGVKAPPVWRGKGE